MEDKYDYDGHQFHAFLHSGNYILKSLGFRGKGMNGKEWPKEVDAERALYHEMKAAEQAKERPFFFKDD